MRQKYREKKRSCPICKPHKAGWEHRLKLAEEIELEEIEREIREREDR